MSDIYLSLTETPSVVTLSQPVISSSVAATVTVGNTVTVALDANSLAALENITVTVGPAISGTVTISNLPATQTIAGTVTANVYPQRTDDVLQENYIPIGWSTLDGDTVVSNHFVSQQNPLPISGTVTANVANIPYVKITDEANNGASVDESNSGLFVSVAGSVTIPISGTVTASLFPQNGTAVQVDGGPNDLVGVRLGYNSGGTEFAIVSDEPNAGLPIQGTVTANVSSPVRLIGSNGDPIGDGGNLIVDVSDVASLPAISGTVTVGNSVTIGSLPSISGTVTANNPSGALTTRFGSVVTANLATLTSAVTNTSRKFLLVQNIATSTVTIGIGFAPTTTQGIQLTAGAGLTFDAFCPTGGVWWLSSTTGSNFSILEG